MDQETHRDASENKGKRLREIECVLKFLSILETIPCSLVAKRSVSWNQKRQVQVQPYPLDL